MSLYVPLIIYSDFFIVGSDFSYVGLSSKLTSAFKIVSGSASGSISINIIDDTVQENNETFNVTLQLQPLSSCLPVTLAIAGENSFTITIIDDEGYYIMS